MGWLLEFYRMITNRLFGRFISFIALPCSITEMFFLATAGLGVEISYLKVFDAAAS